MKLSISSPYSLLFWNEYLLNPHRTDYNIIFDQIVIGDLDIERLKNTLIKLIKQYIILNSHLSYIDNKVCWVINSAISELEIFADDSGLGNFVNSSFNLEEGPLYRFALFRINEQHYNLILVFHHALIDGNSFGFLIDSISDCYNNPDKLINSNQQEQIFRINQLNQDLINKLIYIREEGANKFWQNLLASCDPYVYFPQINSQSQDEVGEYRFSISLDSITDSMLDAVNSTLFRYLVGCYGYILSCYTNSNNIHISYPIKIKEANHLMYGAMINTSVLPLQFVEEDTLITILDKINSHIKNFQSNKKCNYSYLPISEIINNSPIKKLNISFAQTNFKDKTFEFNGCQVISKNRFNISIVGNDLLLEYQKSENAINFRCRYKRNLFDHEFIKQFCKHYQSLVVSLIQQPNKDLRIHNILLREEQQKILYEWNANSEFYPSDKTVYELFAEQVLITPDNIAILFDGQSTTYRQLDVMSNQLAHKIRRYYQDKASCEIKPDTLIALYLERSLEMIVAILATMKSGAAYVPLDTESPDDRISYILADTQTNLIITQTRYINKLENIITSNQFILDIAEYKTYENEPDNLPITNVSSRSLAYVMYTSGTTGFPKGVMIEHQSLVNRLLEMQRYSDITDSDFYCFKTNYIFDVSFSDIFTHLISGAKVICTKRVFDLDELSQIIQRTRLTSIHLVPSQYSLLYELINKSNIQKIYFSGEALTINIVNQIPKHIDLYNYYGPTEAGEITFCKVSRSKKITIGKTFHNTKAFILNSNQIPVPIGVIGELYLSGAALARGYWNNTILTNEKFIVNRFATKDDLAAGWIKLYKTGDLARWMPDGNIEYIGRNDLQVKIRGYRIELREIEEQILKISGIKSVVVRVNQNNLLSEKYLIAYYVLHKSNSNLLKTTNKEVIINKLSSVLPDYMLPTLLVELEKLPLTVNGKLDYSALPQPEFNKHCNFVAPSNFLEQSACKIFSDILDIPEHSIGIHDSFFDLGGNSILAIKLVSHLRKQLNMNISALDIFHKKTIVNLVNKYDDILIDCIDYYEINNGISDDCKQLIFLIPGITEAFERHYLPLIGEFKKDSRYKVVMLRNKYLGLDNLDNAANYYSNLIINLPYINKSIQINLCGFSAGGEIAYRMCHKLKLMGFNSLKLIAIDSCLNRYSISSIIVSMFVWILQRRFPAYEEIKISSKNFNQKNLLRLDVLFFKATESWYKSWHKNFNILENNKFGFLRQLKADLTYYLMEFSHDLRLIPPLLGPKKIVKIEAYHNGENGIMSSHHTSTLKKYIDENII